MSYKNTQNTPFEKPLSTRLCAEIRIWWEAFCFKQQDSSFPWVSLCFWWTSAESADGKFKFK